MSKRRHIKNPIKMKNTNHLNQFFINIFGKGLFLLTLDIARSKNAPLGQRFEHQYLPLKKDMVKRTAIIAKTKYPSIG